ncbi:MAG: hypothetical protein Q8O14_14940 [bacterium]|nr:hypothetical protein [bacterium]
MRKRWLAILPLFWSCADNLPDPTVVDPALSAIHLPEVIVAGWPEALEFRAKASLPATGEWRVELRVSGPELPTPLDYLLLDDGDYLVLTDPGPGQEAQSGDNVAGDGWFTTRLAADFATGLGSFTFRFRLVGNGVERDFRQVTRERLVNRAPEVFAVEAPALLPSGGHFTATARAADPDGAEDLATVQLRQTGGGMRSWAFTPGGDSLWTVTVGPELAAGRQGPDTLRVTATDRVGHEAERSLVVDLENGPPALAGADLQFYLRLGNGGYQPLDTGDTIHLFVPSTDPADSNIYLMTIPAFDPQTLADIREVTWEITAMDNPAQTLTQSMSDPTGDGIYQAGITLAGRPVPYQYTMYFLRFLAYDQFHVSPLEERFIRIHNLNEAPGQPDAWPAGLRSEGMALRPLPHVWRVSAEALR